MPVCNTCNLKSNEMPDVETIVFLKIYLDGALTKFMSLWFKKINFTEGCDRCDSKICHDLYSVD